MRKINNSIWKYIVYIVMVLAIILFSTYLINVLIITKAPFEVAQGNDWIGFWGSVLGSSIGGVITFVVLKITINHENEKREDDKRMSVLPYLDYKIVSDEYINQNVKHKNILTSINKYYPTCNINICAEDRFNMELKLFIENLGLGIAIKPRLDRINYRGGYNDKFGTWARNTTSIGVGNSGIIEINLTMDVREKNIEPMELVVGYFNLRMDYYEQKIKIGFFSVRSPIEANKVVGYKPIIKNISKPIIIANYEEPDVEW
ncbi:hypothetical protein PN294_11175 [Romboutsia sp. 1001216sp1]|uniref:hypothetical protein n=1 Tax=unclassified Romboutsia TaxID=2626894 RepID=UPI00189DC586|nr:MULTISPECIES: hypothetical protein [unclassified Romboutsia]MDB8802754.1 hypothetical protein [Romboutsia sp. 1001216sp1]MDB8814151.1 hypothetical protein [Romboutsia sp. 1001216sp1]